MCDICRVWAILVSMFPSFPCYKEGTCRRARANRAWASCDPTTHVEPQPVPRFQLRRAGSRRKAVEFSGPTGVGNLSTLTKNSGSFLLELPFIFYFYFFNFIFPCTLQLLIHYYKLTIWARDLLETFAGFCF